ncbi:MBL fold metallo-hydrolase [Goodfellowiella coeruleoviolacea]|uniref:L-ascorbate metabolism protein UlaG, beta-lactamase superfamily n=1 Tax=Goodfellowiella coeruleoviolacea TaxID=334858 RepID=A0AAE3KKD4_9PSEU|nr:MBL fold metallo-hydrolase [Goodfellowiella coeruleoviolacea]MCP2165308.1 L-ascorbate metabolism protein UlaG, beta-lactamase superfamily [Goodfellowiella coeruleoviolacea]
MRLTKLGHACVRLELDRTTLVIDPGEFSGPDALAGADVVLVTHEHFDHLDRAALLAAARANTDLVVVTNRAVAGQLGELGERVLVLAHGDSVEVGGVLVRGHGEWHAPTHLPPDPVNVGFFVADEVFYPGDALTVPDRPVGTLLAPTLAPWLKSVELLDYVRRVRPTRLYSTHDGMANELGLIVVDNVVRAARGEGGGDYRRIPPGESVEIG